jgi:hypothetical protein
MFGSQLLEAILLVAAYKGYFQLVERLIEKGVHADQSTEVGLYCIRDSTHTITSRI